MRQGCLPAECFAILWGLWQNHLQYSSVREVKKMNLKMRKLNVAVAVLSLLNTAKLIACYSDGLAMDMPLMSSVGDAGIFPDSLQGVNEGQSLNNIELESTSTATKDQQLTNDYHPTACQLVQIVHLLQHPGCQPKAIASFACSGSCNSYVRTSASSFWQHVRSCSCCRQTGTREATIALDCPSLDPPYRKVKTHAPTDCLCRSCTDLSREDLRPQELVEALAGDQNS